MRASDSGIGPFEISPRSSSEVSTTLKPRANV